MTSTAILNLVVPHLLSIAGLVLGAVLIAHVLAERRASQSTVAWILAIVLIPYVGVPLYLVFGGRKLARDAQRKGPLYGAVPATPALPPSGISGISEMLAVLGAPPLRSRNTVEFLLSGEDAYRATVGLIDGARRSIRLSTLILANDEVGKAIVSRLIAKARAGVEVRLLIDDLFRWRAPRGLLSSLRKAGARVGWFMPVWHVPFRGHANLRLHRKVLIADGQAAELGGMNLAREYMGETPLPGRWRDLGVRIEGPAVADVDEIFRADWNFASGEQLAPCPPPGTSGSAAIQVVGSGPDAPTDVLYDAFLSSAFEARRRYWIATPYFVPDEALMRALILAVRRRVDVRVLVPLRSNHLSADLAGAPYLRYLAESGARIACFRGAMMHAKALLVDDTLAVIGSANFDMRSLMLDYEIALNLSGKDEIDALARWYETTLASCVPLPPAGRARTLVENVARLIGPIE